MQVRPPRADGGRWPNACIIARIGITGVSMAAKDLPTKDELKQAVCEAIDRHGNEIIELGETILHHPETGFNELKTAALVAERDARARPRAADRPRADRGQGPHHAAKRRARASPSSASSTACAPPTTRSPTRTPAPRTAAATTPRSPACSASRWG